MDAIRKLLANVIAPGDDVLVAEARIVVAGIPNSGGHGEKSAATKTRGEGKGKEGEGPLPAIK